MAILLKQSTASQEVPLGYFLDSTDGNTEETALTINNTDIKIWKSGATTLANKSSGGATHISNGVYYATLDATDTDTLGPLVIFSHVSGALAVRLECMVLASNVYDSIVGGTDLLDVNAVQLGGTAQTGRDVGASVLLSSGTGAGQISLASGAVTVGTSNDKTGYSISGTLTTLDALDTAQDSQHSTTQAAIAALNDIAATDIVSAGPITTLSGAVVNVDTVDTLTTYTGNTPQTGDSFARLGAPSGASVSADVAAVKAETASIVADTSELQTDWANGGRLDLILDARAAEATVAALNDITVAQVLTTQMTESYAANGAAPTLAQALFAIQQFLSEFSIGSTTYTVKKVDGTTTAMTFTLDDATNPTAISRAS